MFSTRKSPYKLVDFKGLMAPVFTPFDKNLEVNYKAIERYAKQLNTQEIKAILVNGTSGEGMSLTVDERKKLTEAWAEECAKYEILLMVQIGGCPYADVIELAKHAAEVKVDGVLCLPELYFKPKTIEKLVDYLGDIANHCPNLPLYYYHIPMFTQVDLPMASFMELAKTKIHSFAGIKYTSGDLEKGVPCLKHGQVFLGSDTILSGALVLGFESAIMTSLNIFPEHSFNIIKFVEDGKLLEARAKQIQLTQFVERALKKGNGEWVPSMKKAFNEEFNLVLGPTRKPL